MSQNHNRDNRIPREGAASAANVGEDPRNSRAFETRDTFQRPDAWAPPDTLPMPKEHPDWVFRYVRTALLGEDDPTNIHRARREGFEPVRAVDHPEIAAISDSKSRFPDGIEIGGLLLCKAPRKFMEDRQAFYERQTAMQQQAIDNNLMRESDSRMPLLPAQRKSKVTFGSGE